MFEDIPADIGLVHVGERIRKNDMFVELGGPSVQEKFELVRVRKPEDIPDEKITIIGPDLAAMQEGMKYPLGILVEIAGPQLEEDIEGVIERRIHEYTNYIEGFMHLNQRYDIWVRVSKKAYAKGFTTLSFVGKVLIALLKNELPLIEKMEVTFFTEKETIAARYADALKVYEARDARARGLTDNDVDVFYGCALCQSFAPSHVCVITPQRYANCGAISWFDGRAAARIDPKGPIFPISKGECLDPVKGEYSGINESAKKRSLGTVHRIFLYSAFTCPHTSCGCFEGIAFYIPEVEGFGIVMRGYKDVTVNGLPFSTMADSTAGGRQVDGFHGISLEYMRSPRFLAADGGFARVVWMPSDLREQLREFIPVDLFGKIATEKDVRTVSELRDFLSSQVHPVMERWKTEENQNMDATQGAVQVFSGGDFPIMSGGFKLIFKNARITADRVIIEPIQTKKPGGNS
ncbi:MAG: CO dehydrogenase/CO-methylating acetyl-CoA synthase complex subunit beta [Methanoregula sp.]|jgi:acetyl-CoA decarbonylase/synthase complex subunit beta